MNKIMEPIVREIETCVTGKQTVIRKLLTALLAEGHVLLDDAPGTGKTNLALAVSRVLGLHYGRIQCTPDVLPSDIVGFSMYNRETGEFVYRPGIVNQTNLLLADEINRTSAKTQSALLEAMEEQQVTVDGMSYPLPKPFLVIATQNQIGTTGTQPLPYAQMDRFLMCLDIGYPDVQSQISIMRDRLRENPLDKVRQMISAEDFRKLQQAVRQTTVSEPVLDYIARIAQASRQDGTLSPGLSPRGALALCAAARGCAFIHGRKYVLPEDVQEIFFDVCCHRVLPVRGADAPAELQRILHSVPVPDDISAPASTETAK